MIKLKLALVASVCAVSLAIPSTSSAQGTDVGALCHSILGSGTTFIGPVYVNRCLASNPPKCTLSNTIDVLNLVRIRLGQCVTFGFSPLAGVRGVVTVGIVP